MTIFVDPLMAHGWRLHGRMVRSCHMFTDQQDLAELHAMAEKIGCHAAWFQDKSTPHYDLVESRRVSAVAFGAVAVDRRKAVKIWRALRYNAGGQPA